MKTEDLEAGEYGAGAIRVLEGLEAVRVRPAMYIGSTGEAGLHHLVYEVVDNSVDEALAGFCSEINVTIHIDNSVTVIDNGRGIPVGPHPTVPGMDAAEVVLTKLHAGGKFDKGAYKVSGGLHGVGISVVNALSETLDVEIWRDKKVYRQSYERGAPTTKLENTGVTDRRGTKVTFKPDTSIFETTTFSFDTLSQRLRELSFLNRGIVISLEERAYGFRSVSAVPRPITTSACPKSAATYSSESGASRCSSPPSRTSRMSWPAPTGSSRPLPASASTGAAGFERSLMSTFSQAPPRARSAYSVYPGIWS